MFTRRREIYSSCVISAIPIKQFAIRLYCFDWIKVDFIIYLKYFCINFLFNFSNHSLVVFQIIYRAIKPSDMDLNIRDRRWMNRWLKWDVQRFTYTRINKSLKVKSGKLKNLLFSSDSIAKWMPASGASRTRSSAHRKRRKEFHGQKTGSNIFEKDLRKHLLFVKFSPSKKNSFEMHVRTVRFLFSFFPTQRFVDNGISSATKKQEPKPTTAWLLNSFQLHFEITVQILGITQSFFFILGFCVNSIKIISQLFFFWRKISF